MMLNGHIDTNPAGEGWTKDPFSGAIEDGCVYGIGVSNMKAADAAMIEAFTAVRDSGVSLNGDVCLALVIGELQGGIGTTQLIDAGVRTDHFIVGEPTDLTLLTLHAGPFECDIHIIGRTRHISKMEHGVSAIDKAFAVIERLHSLRLSGAASEEHAGLNRLNVGVIRGGVSREYADWRAAQVPDFCTIRVAGRVAPSQSTESAVRDIHEMLSEMRRADPELEFEIGVPEYARAYMPPFEIEQTDPFVQQVANTLRSLGREPVIGAPAPYKFYGTDAAHLAGRGMRGVVCGPGGKFNTMPDERVEITDVTTAAQLYALTILATCGSVA